MLKIYRVNTPSSKSVTFALTLLPPFVQVERYDVDKDEGRPHCNMRTRSRG